MDQTRIVTLDNGYHLFTRKVNEGPTGQVALRARRAW